jgi:hypothetical protein
LSFAASARGAQPIGLDQSGRDAEDDLASAGCGVAIVGARRAATAVASWRLVAMRLSASASSTIGTSLAIALATNVFASAHAEARPADERVGSRVQHIPRARSISWAGPSRWKARRRGESDPHLAGAGVQRRAPGSNGAPTMPSAPPTMPKRAEGSLVHVARGSQEHARQSGGQRVPVEPVSGGERERLGIEAQSMDGHIATRVDTVPVSNPGFSAMNVAVAVARMALPMATPRSASRPLGTSSASIGLPLTFARSTRAAYSAASGRARPMPNNPSTMSEPDQPSGKSVTEVPPAATNARWAAAASVGSLAESPRKTTLTSKNATKVARDDERVAPIIPRPREHEHRAVALADHRAGDSEAARPARHQGQARRGFDRPQFGVR